MQYTPQQKHRILTHYRAGKRGAGFAALARRFDITGGAAVIKRWHDKWDGTPQSLHHKQGAGRPRTLSSREVQQHVRAPILRANRKHRVVHYAQVQKAVQASTGKNLSLRTVQRYGKEELKARSTHGKKRTAEECKSTTGR